MMAVIATLGSWGNIALAGQNSCSVRVRDPLLNHIVNNILEGTNQSSVCELCHTLYNQKDHRRKLINALFRFTDLDQAKNSKRMILVDYYKDRKDHTNDIKFNLFGHTLNLGRTGVVLKPALNAQFKYRPEVDYRNYYYTAVHDLETNMAFDMDTYLFGRAKYNVIRVRQNPGVNVRTAIIHRTPSIEVSGVNLPGHNGRIDIVDVNWGLLDRMNTKFYLQFSHQKYNLGAELKINTRPLLGDCFRIPSSVEGKLKANFDGRIDIVADQTKALWNGFFYRNRAHLFTQNITLLEGSAAYNPKIKIPLKLNGRFDPEFENQKPVVDMDLFPRFGKLVYQREDSGRSCRRWQLFRGCVSTSSWSPWRKIWGFTVIDFDWFKEQITK